MVRTHMRLCCGESVADAVLLAGMAYYYAGLSN